MESTVTAEILTPKENLPSRGKAFIFRLKVMGLQLKRSAENLINPGLKKHSQTSTQSSLPVLAESRSSLWTESSAEEQMLILGKIQNLRKSVQRIHGLELPAGVIFSFWKQTGKASQRKGFVRGRELREGCIIPAVGGGLCQLSNALYDAALKAGLEIIERHAHSRVVPGSLAEKGRDATVFWNYVDLRFRTPAALRIEVELNSDELIVRLRGEPKLFRPEDESFTKDYSGHSQSDHGPNNCLTCGTEDCHRYKPPKQIIPNKGNTAFLLDEFWPEYQEFIAGFAALGDACILPLDPKRFSKPQYAWQVPDDSRMHSADLQTLYHAWRIRRLPAQGASLQSALQDRYRALARAYSRKLRYSDGKLVISQELLPYLWEMGELAGREFNVLMTRLPLDQLQQRLDTALSMHPESTTLGDFRINATLVEAEYRALATAAKIITPHTDIAGLFPDKSIRLNWFTPTSTGIDYQPESDTLFFPASTLGRKGAYELRDALEGLPFKLKVLGKAKEKDNFWGKIKTEHGTPDDLYRTRAVVYPAHIEHKPRILLKALGAGIPVIATPACGIPEQKGLTIVPAGDVDALREAVLSVIK